MANFGPRPGGTKVPAAVLDQHVNARAAELESARQPPQPEKGQMKRFTIDLPAALHREARRKALDTGISMADAARFFYGEWIAGRLTVPPRREEN
jgi:hypothetical protein